jgi:hypothetical protein
MTRLPPRCLTRTLNAPHLLCAHHNIRAFSVSFHALTLLAAMASESVIVPPSEAAAPLNFIYSCSVCCYTLADVYEGRVETVKGLSDGINSKERLVTHLYLASCCHVFCGSHLDGGGEFKAESALVQKETDTN